MKKMIYTSNCKTREVLDAGEKYGIKYYILSLGKEKLQGFFVGWDYAHYGDYAGYEELYPEEYRTGGKKYTTEEILKEVEDNCERISKFDTEYAQNSDKNKLEEKTWIIKNKKNL